MKDSLSNRADTIFSPLKTQTTPLNTDTAGKGRNPGMLETGMLEKLRNLISRRRDRPETRHLYAAIVVQARHPDFYRNHGVPDSLDGRFDMVILHAYLVMHRLNAMGGAGAGLAQSLFDFLFDDMDANLREIGVGDLSVGKRVKAMAKAFYGRSAAYDAGLAEPTDAPLLAALRRNLYGTVPDEPPPAALAAMARYLRENMAALAAQKDADLLAGKVAFLPPPAGNPAH